MKKVLTVFFLCLTGLASTAPAQDVIVMLNGNEIEAKVLEISPDEVKYKRASNESGPTYRLPTYEINIIVYENGDEELFVPMEEESDNEIQSDYSHRSPGAAFGLSLLYPGFGQFYNRQIGKGITMASIGSAGLILTVWGFHGIDYADNDDQASGYASLAVLGLIAHVGMRIWSMVDAPIWAGVLNRRNENPLGWNVGNGKSISLNPDIVYINPVKGAADYKSAGYGLSLKFDF
jgi:TM2 domain-containing membrane protein YozV